MTTVFLKNETGLFDAVSTTYQKGLKRHLRKMYARYSILGVSSSFDAVRNRKTIIVTVGKPRHCG